MKRVALLAAIALFVLVGCSSDQNIKPPHKLVDFTPRADVTQIWDAHVGEGSADTSVRLRPAYSDGVIYAISTQGTVEALDAETGETIWKKHDKVHGLFGWGDGDGKDVRYAGGPAVVSDLLVVGTLDGHVYALDPKDGSELWKTRVSAGVLSTPVIIGDRVVVRTNDGNISALDANDGTQQWLYDQNEVPLLSLRGNGDIRVVHGVVFLGSDDGKLQALRLDNGKKLWELPLSNGEGSSEIAQLDDADGNVLIQGNTLYATAYQGNILAVNAPSARTMWKQDFSSYVAMDVSPESLVAVDDASNVWAFDPATGSNQWEQDKLDWRWLSAPSIQGDYVVVGDRQGYIHWLDISDGSFVARAHLSNDAIRARPLIVDDVAYIEDTDGHIAAYKISGHND